MHSKSVSLPGRSISRVFRTEESGARSPARLLASDLPQQDFLKREEVPPTPYLETRTGNYYNIGHKGRHG